MEEATPRFWLWALIGLACGFMLALLMVLSATPNCGLNPSVRTAEGDTASMPDLPGTVEKGRLAQAQRGWYLTTVGACAFCHTPVDPLTGPYTAEALSGGVVFKSQYFGSLYSANLTPDLRSGIGPIREDRARLRSALRGGLSTRGYSMHPAAMPWHIIGRTDSEDLECITTYLMYTTAVSRSFAPRGPIVKDSPEGVAMGLGSWSKAYE
jgi:hypothetical protein